MKKIALILLALTITLNGCSSPKDANKSNFKKALDNYLSENCVLLSPGLHSFVDFPITIEDTDFYQKDITKFDAFVDVGLLDIKKGTMKVQKGFITKKEVTVPTKIYSLSKKGKSIYKKKKSRGGFSTETGGFCVAQYYVDEIQNFSEPSEMMGYTVSEVQYTFSAKDIQPWSNNATIVKIYPHLAKRLEQNQEKSTTLVLLNDGWVHKSKVRRR